eukprot:1031553-Pleurochrysis_carterae.AAC.1
MAAPCACADASAGNQTCFVSWSPLADELMLPANVAPAAVVAMAAASTSQAAAVSRTPPTMASTVAAVTASVTASV